MPHAVLHADMLAQMKPPAHEALVPAVQVPAPSQVLCCCKVPELHDMFAQTVPDTHFSQAPWPSHMPSSPHVDLAVAVHCPEGAVLPATMLPQVPSLAAPVSAARQAMHVPLQAVSQQTLLTQ
jgi:hypothetical protein